MELVPFVAQSAADAAEQIRNRLGPQAVVVHVRPVAGRGLARLWRKPRFEVLAYRPDPAISRLDVRSDAPAAPDAPLDTQPNLADAHESSSPAASAASAPELLTAEGWRMSQILERAGFLPANAQRVVDRLDQRFGPPNGRSLAEELTRTRQTLADLWRRPPALLPDSMRPHVFVGPPGAGKTTVLSKWLTQVVLLEGRPAHVWRLDGSNANTAEALEVYCQALGVPIDRSWHVNGDPQDAAHFIDLPGANWRDPASIDELSRQLRSYLSPHIHLVLNAAYETPILLAQIRAFAVLPVEDLILTHLDEEPRWGRLWNLVLGTNFPLRFLSAGQNIPGDFLQADPEALISRLFPS